MSSCCTDCCPEDQEPGILSGVERELPGLDETLTTYFHNELHRKRIHPLKVALVFEEQKLTFISLQFQSTAIANALKTLLSTNFSISNPDNDLVICLCLPPSEKLIVLIFGILKLGGTYLPLDPTYPNDVKFKILKTFRPIIVIHSIINPIPITTTEPRFITIESLWIDMFKLCPNIGSNNLDKFKEDKIVEVIPLPQETRANERPAIIIHTTGLHHTPRGVRISHSSIMNRISWTWHNVPYRNNGTCCLNLPITFIESLHQIFSPLLRGITLNIYNNADSNNMATLISKLGKDAVTRISFSPVILGKFLNECRVLGKDNARMSLRKLKFVACKGEILTYDLAKRFFDMFPADGKTLAIMYGYTELSGDVICERFNDIKDVRKRIVAGHLVLGQVMDNTKIYIMNVNHELAVNLEQGQVCVGGTPLAMGYVNKRSKDFSFINNPYDSSQKYCRLFLTGDFARYVVCRDRRFRLLLEGRGDSFIRHNGYEFVIEDIKEILKEHDEIEHVNIFIIHPGKHDQTILAFVLPKDEFLTKLTNESVLEYLGRKVPSFMVPTVKVVQSFPVLGNGRLDRHKLFKDYLEEKDSGFMDWSKLKLKNEESIEAGQILLQALFKFCSIPIKLSIKSLHSSFYSLGGSSLTTICIVLYLNKQGFPISIQDFIGADSIEDLINLMENRRQLQRFRRLNQTIPLPSSDSRPMIALTIDSRATQMYTSKHMEAKHQKDAVQLIATAYTRHGDLEKVSMVSDEQLIGFLNINWDAILEQQMCFVIIRNADTKVVGVALNYDFFTDLDTEQAVGPLKYVMEFGHEVKGQVLAKLDEADLANEIYECFLMGTYSVLPSGENVRVTVLMINEILKRALSDGFKSVFIASTNQLIRDLLLEIYEFKLLDDYVVNEYKDNDGVRPFHLAPGTLTMSSFYKVLRPQGPLLLPPPEVIGDVASSKTYD